MPLLFLSVVIFHLGDFPAGLYPKENAAFLYYHFHFYFTSSSGSLDKSVIVCAHQGFGHHHHTDSTVSIKLFI